MPQLTLKIEGKNFPAIEAGRKVENFADLSKLFAQVQKSLRGATRMFPSLKDAKIERVSVRAN